jgi:hypothetical protein
MPGAVVRFFDTGHFALETHVEEIAGAIRDFLAASICNRGLFRRNSRA